MVSTLQNSKKIVFEGIDGSGKTTQIKFLQDFLQDKGYTVHVTREPGGSETAEKIRDLFFTGGFHPLTQLLLCTAARKEHLLHLEKLYKGAEPDFIIFDRFTDSTLAYQIIPFNYPPIMLEKLNQLIKIDCEPDLTLIFDVDPKRTIRRKNIKSINDADTVFLSKVRAAYIQISLESKKKILLDANFSIEMIFRKTLEEVKKHFKIDK